MDVFGQIRYFTPQFIPDIRWDPSNYATQLRHNRIENILNYFGWKYKGGELLTTDSAWIIQ